MASSINVTLLDARSDNDVLVIPTPEGTTVREFLAFNKVSTENSSVTLRLDGEAIAYDLDDELECGCRVCVTPTNVKGQ